MKKSILQSIITFTITFSLFQAATAQSGIYIPSNANVFFAGDTASLFSNVHNDGNLIIANNAVVNFEGKSWKNDSKATINKDSVSKTAGLIRFHSTASAPQHIDGGYNAVTRTGASFPNLQVDSKAGVELNGSTTKVSQELTLSNGLVYLKDNILIVGDTNPGSINGYNSSRYIVMNNSSNEGFLIRENITSKDSLVVFPVGSKKDAYTPVAIRTNSLMPDHFYVNVVDGVKNTGSQTDLNNNSVGKTWQIGKQLHPGQDEVTVVLEHLKTDEGNVFRNNSINAYISQLQNDVWNKRMLENASTNASLTTGTYTANSGINSRLFNGTISGASYFTKFTEITDTVTKNPLLWLYDSRVEETHQIKIWPNPTPNRFYIGILGSAKIKTMVIWDAIGRIIHQEAVNGRTQMEVSGFVPGTYMVGFISTSGQITETKKVIVAGW